MAQGEMKWLLNFKVVEQMNGFSSDNRAFSYGDGLFETMLWMDGHLPLGSYHENRLHKGMEAMGLNADESCYQGYWLEKIDQLAAVNNLSNDSYQVKFQVWRKPGGKYVPQTNQIEHYLLIFPYQQNSEEKEACISQKIAVHPSIISTFKTINALPYVLAGLEMQQRNRTEIIIPSADGMVAECLYSNIFWVKDERYFTPPLTTGCKMGTMRAHLIEKLAQRGTPVKEVLMPVQALFDVDYIFTTSATGINPIVALEHHRFDAFPDIPALLPF